MGKLEELIRIHAELIIQHGGTCEICGCTDSDRLMFVHRPGHWQEFSLSGMNLIRPKEQLDKEIRKCEILCPDCVQRRV